MAKQFEFGLDTFGDVTAGQSGELLSQAEVIRNVVEEAVLADELGVNAFGVGEHHRPDFAVSAPEIVLGTIAGRTKHIHLGSAVTVLSTDDPIRVFERFSTLNAASGGRAEITVGRGSFTESFPLFGYELANYEVLFEEKLDLFVALLKSDKVTWQGNLRPPLKDQGIYPRIEDGPLKTWVGVGGSPESVVRAAHYDLPLALAIIGGDPRRFQPFVDLYRRAFAQYGRPVKDIAVHSPGHVADTDAQAREEYWTGYKSMHDKIGGDPKRFQPFVDLYRRAFAQYGRQVKDIAVHSPGHVADTDAQAREEYWTGYKSMHDKIGGERGWPPIGRAQFEQEVERGSLYVGAPETVARKIASTAKALGLMRFDMKYSGGTLPHDKMMRSIELYGTKVMPLVRETLG